MKQYLTAALFIFGVTLTVSAQAKPSYSFGDGPRRCTKDEDCALIIVSCHNCNWADSVNKQSLKESEATVKKYCEEWKRRPDREPDCKDVPKVKSRELVCVNHLCEAHTFFIFDEKKKN